QFRLRLPSRLNLMVAPAVAFDGVLDVFQKQLIPFVRMFPSGVISFLSPFQFAAGFNLFKHAVTSPILLAFKCVWVGGVSPVLVALIRRSFDVSIPSLSASISIARSMRNVISLCPNPRYDVAYGWFVYTQ